MHSVFFHIVSETARFSEKITEHKTCVLILCITFVEIYLLLRIIQRDIIMNLCRFSCKAPVILVRL